MSLCRDNCTCVNPHRKPPTSSYVPSFTTREIMARRDELAATTGDAITGLDQLQAHDVLRWIAAPDLNIVREACNEVLS